MLAGKPHTSQTSLKEDLKITFRTTQTTANLLTQKDRTHDKYSPSGVYKLTCPDSMAQPQYYLQFRTTPHRRRSLIWTHE
jgi:hypothetical protein